MICLTCSHKKICEMWIYFISSTSLFRDVETDKIPSLSKIEKCMYYLRIDNQ